MGVPMMEDESLRLCYPAGDADAGESAKRLVATGRGVLRFALGDDEQRYRLLAGSIRWDCVVLAMRGNDALGFAAIKRRGRGPYAPGLGAFARVFGPLGGYWRWVLFWLLEWRDLRFDFYLHGLKVVPEARRQRVAYALVETAIARVRQAGGSSLVLEVSERNKAALALYEELGFVTVRVVSLGWLSRFFGFAHLHQMRCDVPPGN